MALKVLEGRAEEVLDLQVRAQLEVLIKEEAEETKTLEAPELLSFATNINKE